MVRWTWLGVLSAALAVSGCGDDANSSDNGNGGSGGATASSGAGGSGGGTGGGGSGGGVPVIFGDDRPVELFVPDNYDSATAAPLMILLHGYSASGLIQDAYFGLKDVANENGILYAHPDGTVDGMEEQFWNATDACCDFFSTGVDDSAYLRKLVDDIKAAYNVDDKRVYFIGHSNGGFMSYRMACDHADSIAAIVSLAGATFADEANCSPSEPVHVLQIHGTVDDTIAYDGGDIIGNSYPSAAQSAAFWANTAGCDTQMTSSGPPLDLDSGLDGDETTVQRYDQGCMAGGSAELWTIVDGGHIPQLGAGFAQQVVSFMLAHPKP